VTFLEQSAVSNQQSDAPELEVHPVPNRVYLDAEYLGWWIRNSYAPPLLTVGSFRADNPGALGMAGTAVVLGGKIDNEDRSGGRFTAGLWLSEDQLFGVEGNFFFLDKRSVNYAIGSSGAPGSPLLARPFFDITTGLQDADPVSLPGQLAGDVSFAVSSRLFGAEAYGRFRALHDWWYHLDLLGGFRFLELDENLGVVEHLQELPAGPGLHVTMTDDFSTRNRFYGGEVGADAEFQWNQCFLGLKTKVAFGRIDQAVDVAGTTEAISPTGMSTMLPSGLLALPTNSGHHNRSLFAAVPGADVTLGYRLTHHLQVHVGYTFLYLDNVARPANQIDRVINITQVPTAQNPGVATPPFRPAFIFRGTEFWAQGLAFGLEIAF
jgi:hypothetical protein